MPGKKGGAKESVQIPRKVKKVWDVATTVLITLVVLLAVILVGARLFGLQVYSVMSGSMVPKVPVGSLIYVQEVDYTTLRPREIITFRLNDKTICTHRIVRVNQEDGYSFSTKGDANDDEDGEPVPAEAVIGKVVAILPLVGYVAFFIQHPQGRYIAIAVGAILLLLVFLPELFGEEKKPSEETGDLPEVSI